MKRSVALLALCSSFTACGAHGHDRQPDSERYMFLEGDVHAGEGAEITINGVEIRSTGKMYLELHTRVKNGEELVSVRTLGGQDFAVEGGEFYLSSKSYGQVMEGDIVFVDDTSVYVNDRKVGDHSD